MCIFACRHHWASTSVRVCVSQRGSVSVWVVSTRNNTLPWDLLNGHHLSLSVKALGKLILRLRCFSPAASRNQPTSFHWKEKKENKNWKGGRKKNTFSETENIDGKEAEWNPTADCISKDGDCDSVLYLQRWKVQPVAHQTFLTWIWLVILSQCKQVLDVTSTHTLTKSSTWANSLSAEAHIKSLSFIVKAPFSAVFPPSSLLFSFSTQPTGLQIQLMHLCPCVSVTSALPACLYICPSLPVWPVMNQSVCVSVYLSFPPPRPSFTLHVWQLSG